MLISNIKLLKANAYSGTLDSHMKQQLLNSTF